MRKEGTRSTRIDPLVRGRALGKDGPHPESEASTSTMNYFSGWGESELEYRKIKLSVIKKQPGQQRTVQKSISQR